jgi:F0F1-type ATP synthase assembly protein I
MKNWVPAFQLLGIGFYVAACIAGGILGGWWLGGKKPVFVIIGLVIGLVLAVVGVYRMIKPLMNNIKNNKNDKDNG